MTTIRNAALASLLAACGTVTGNTHENGPTIASLAPTNGSVVGGTMVTITGTNFSSGTAYVIVGGHLATNVTVASSTSITFVAPAGDQEGATVDVEVSTTNGEASAPQSFTYNFQPVVISISPAGGKITGGTPVTIVGRGFMAASAGMATVKIAGTNATSVTVVDDKTIMATTGMAMAGTRAFVPNDVIVSNTNGTGTLAKAFSMTKQGLLAVGPSTRCCGSTNVVYIDPSDGSIVTLPAMGIHAHSCALGPDGNIYVVGGPGGTSGNTPRQLFTEDPLTGNTTMVGALQTAANVTKNLAAMTTSNGALLGTDTASQCSPTCTSGSRLLVSVNTSTGVVTQIGTTAMAIGNANGIAPNDATTVFVADNITGTLDTINTSTSARVAGKTMTGGSGDTVKGLVNTGNALFIAGNNTQLVYTATIGATTVTLTQLATLTGQFQQLAGLCQTPTSF